MPYPKSGTNFGMVKIRYNTCKFETMKRLTIILASSLLLIFATGNFVAAQEQDHLGLPGDNLNLFAVLKLFQDSETLEGFERGLNDESLNINNLDLDGDNHVDYVNVTDVQNGNVHNIVLQVAVNTNEIQDVAVINVYRDNHDQLHVQCIGDEDLYGKDYIIEPNVGYAQETPNPGYTGTHHTEVQTTTYVEVNTWPLIRFIFMPTYVAWRSPWHYGYYPTYWRPWNPYYWDYYYGYHSNMHDYYAHHYRYYHEYRDPHYHDFYHDRRAESPMVHHRIEEGQYRPTYGHPEQREEGRNKYISQHPEQNQPGHNPPQQNDINHGKRPSNDHNIAGHGGQPAGTNGNNHGQQGTRPTTTTNGGRPATSGNMGRPSQATNAGRPSQATNANRPSTATGAGRPSTATGTGRPSTATGGNGGRPATSVNRGSNSNSAASRPASQSVNRPSAPASRESNATTRSMSGGNRPASAGREATGSNRGSSSVSSNRPSNASGGQVKSTSVNKSSNNGSRAGNNSAGKRTTEGTGQSSNHQKPSSTRGDKDKK
jgi:hypothetical protein